MAVSIKNKYFNRKGVQEVALGHSIEDLKRANMKTESKNEVIHQPFEKEIEQKMTTADNDSDRKFYGKVLEYIRKSPGIDDNGDFLGYFRMVERTYQQSNKGVKKIIADTLLKEEIKLELKIGSLSFSKKIL